MDQGVAYTACDTWARAQPDVPQAQQLQTDIVRALAHLIPDESVVAFAPTRDSPPQLAILVESGLFLVSASGPGEGSGVVRCARVPWLRELLGLSVVQDWAAAREGPVGSGAIRRLWTLTVRGSDPITIQGLDHETGMDKGLDAGERIGRALARHLEWNLGTDPW